MGEVVADEQERFVAVASESVSEAITKVEFRTGVIATPIAPMGIPRSMRLGYRYRDDLHLKVTDKIVQVARCPACGKVVGDQARLNKVGS